MKGIILPNLLLSTGGEAMKGASFLLSSQNFFKQISFSKYKWHRMNTELLGFYCYIRSWLFIFLSKMCSISNPQTKFC